VTHGEVQRSHANERARPNVVEKNVVDIRKIVFTNKRSNYSFVRKK
jgi:hypothetical protein